MHPQATAPQHWLSYTAHHSAVPCTAHCTLVHSTLNTGLPACMPVPKVVIGVSIGESPPANTLCLCRDSRRRGILRNVARSLGRGRGRSRGHSPRGGWAQVIGFTTLSVCTFRSVCPLLAAALPTTLLPRHGASFRATAVFRFVLRTSRKKPVALQRSLQQHTPILSHKIVCHSSRTASPHHG